MSRFSSATANAARNLAIAGVLGVGVGLGYGYLRQFIKLDPFAAYRRDSSAAANSVGIRLDDVHLRHYSGPKLVTEAQVGRIDVRRDRQAFSLFDITDGKVFGPGNEGPIQFDALTGNWNMGLQTLNVQGGVHAKNANFDLSSRALTFDKRKGLVTLPNPLKGRLMDGQITAGALRYRLASGAFEAGPIHYVGTLKVLQDPQAVDTGPPTKWDIQCERVKSGGTKTNSQTYIEGTATDGEIVVSAPLLVRDTKTDVLTATGRVHYYSAKADLVADKVVVYRKEKRAVLTGDVQMLVKSKEEEAKGLSAAQVPNDGEVEPFRPAVPGAVAAKRPSAPSSRSPEDKKLDDELQNPDTLRSYPLHVSAPSIEYWYAKGHRRAKIVGSPRAHQLLPGNRWRTIDCHDALYDGEKETLLLNSTPGKKDTHFKDSIGDDLLASNFTVSTKEDDDEYEGEGIVGSFHADDEDLPKKDQTNKDQAKPDDKKTAAPPPTKAGGGHK